MATRPWSERRALIGSLAVLAAIVAIDVVFPDITLSGSYAVAAVVAAAMTTVRTTAQVAVLSLALSVLSGFWNQSFGTLDWTLRVVLTVGLGALAVLSARTQVHREHDLRRMTVIAEAAQRCCGRCPARSAPWASPPATCPRPGGPGRGRPLRGGREPVRRARDRR